MSVPTDTDRRGPQLPRSMGAESEPDSMLVGIKIAATSPEVQHRLGCSRPIWGWLTDAMELHDGACVEGPEITSMRAEAELVFILGQDLRGPGVTYRDVLAATDAVCPGIELPTRLPPGVKPSVNELMARNTLAGKFVLGYPVANWHHLDLTLIGVVLDVNGEPVASGTPAAVLGHPARAIASVVNDLADAATDSISTPTHLRAGQIVFTGGITASVAMSPGISVEARFAHLGSVGIHTANDETVG